MKHTQCTTGSRNARKEFALVLGLVAVATVPISVLPAAAQQQSNDVRNMTVEQRPRDQFDPKGIPMGSGFRLFPSVQLSETYTDNLYATKDNTDNDYLTTISPEVKIASNWSRHSLTASGFANINRYLDHGTEDNDEYGGDVGLNLDLAQGGTLGLGGAYNHHTIQRGDPENAGRLQPEVVDQTSASLAWAQKFSFLVLGAKAGFLKLHEDSALDREKNRNEYNGSFRAGYSFSPALNAFVEPYYILRDYDLPADPTHLPFPNIDRDSEVMGLRGGIEYNITGVLYGEPKVGWYRAGFKDPGTKSDSGLSVESDTTWNITARDSFILTLKRENIPTNDPGASSRVLTGGGLVYQHELRRNIVLSGNFSYYSDKFVNSFPNRTDDRIVAGAEGKYYFNRYLYFFMQYTRYDINSTIDTESFKTNEIMIGFRTQI